MIKNIQITSFRNETLTIELANPEKSGFAISGITGLGPVKAEINTTENGINDGAAGPGWGLWYNKALLRKENLTDPAELVKQGKWNWDTFLNYCQKLTKKAPTGKPHSTATTTSICLLISFLPTAVKSWTSPTNTALPLR